MAWISLHSLKTCSTGFILTHTAVLFFRPVSFGSTSAYHGVALCASTHRMSREKWQHKANLPTSVSERSISKCNSLRSSWFEEERYHSVQHAGRHIAGEGLKAQRR